MGRHTEPAPYNVNPHADRMIRSQRDGRGNDTEKGDLIDAKLNSVWESGGRDTTGSRNRKESNHPNTKDSRWGS